MRQVILGTSGISATLFKFKFSMVPESKARTGSALTLAVPEAALSNHLTYLLAIHTIQAMADGPDGSEIVMVRLAF